MSIFVKRKKKQPAVLAKYDGHFREPLCRGPRIDYRGNIYDRLRDIQVIAKASLCFPFEFQEIIFRAFHLRSLSKLLSLSLSLFFTRSSARKRASIEYTFASKCTRGNMGDDNVDGSSSCERVRNRTFMKCR